MDYFKNMDNFELNRFHSVIFFILTVFLSGSGLFGDYVLPLERKIPSIRQWLLSHQRPIHHPFQPLVSNQVSRWSRHLHRVVAFIRQCRLNLRHRLNLLCYLAWVINRQQRHDHLLHQLRASSQAAVLNLAAVPSLVSVFSLVFRCSLVEHLWLQRLHPYPLKRRR